LFIAHTSVVKNYLGRLYTLGDRKENVFLNFYASYSGVDKSETAKPRPVCGHVKRTYLNPPHKAGRLFLDLNLRSNSIGFRIVFEKLVRSWYRASVTGKVDLWIGQVISSV
jgi:hypothetical protein